MAWPFNSGDNKKRRRMGQMAKSSLQARWEKFFSGREVAVSEVPPPSQARIKRPAKITEYDEPSTEPKRGRSLPRWRRTLQAAFWKTSRPLRAFHHRVPAAMLVVLYLGLLGALSALLILLVLPAQPPVAPLPEAASSVPAPATTPAEKKLTFQPDPQAGKAARALTLRDGSERTMTAQMADIEFRAGNYEEAEKLYRVLFPKSDTKPFMGYRIYVCCLLREEREKADDLLPRLARIGGETPAWLYAKATRAYRDGRPEEAAELLAEARALYGDKCVEYNGTLRLLGYQP